MSFNKKHSIAFLCAAILVLPLTGCNNKTGNADNSTSSNTENAVELTVLPFSEEEMFSDRDKNADYDTTDAVSVQLSDGNTSCDSSSVTTDGDTITIHEEGTYLLSGTLSNGQIVVDAQNAKVQLVLNSVSVSNASTAALYVVNADKVFLTLAEGSENSFSTAGAFTPIDENTIDSSIFSKSDLTFNGTGALNVSCPEGHGIVSKDDLKITGGSYTIEASGHAISGKDSVRIFDGTFTLTSGKDGIHSENTDDTDCGFIYVTGGDFTIVSDGDGLDASGELQMAGGNFDITTGGGSANATMKTGENFGQTPGGFGGRGDHNNRNPEAPDWSSLSEEELQELKEKMESERPSMPEGQTPPDNQNTPPTQTLPTTENGESGIPESTDRIDKTETTDNTNNTDSTETTETTETTDTTDSTPSTKGIKSDAGMYLTDVTLVIDSADDSIHAGGDLQIENGTYQLTSGDDGIHTDSHLVVEDGTITIVNSYEGLEGLTITIHGGDITTQANDDGLNAAGGKDSSGFGGNGKEDIFAASDDDWIEITGGTLLVTAGGDGLDSNGDLKISGGEIYVNGPTNNGNAAIDYAGTATITGGTILAVGSSGMMQNFDEETSTQGSILVAFSSTCSEEVTITDANGNVLLSFTPSKSFNCVLVSSPDIVKGGTYTITCGNESCEVEMTSLIYENGGQKNGMTPMTPSKSA